MKPGDKPGPEAAIISDNSSFKEVVDETCNRLWDTKVRHSMRRIQELEEKLLTLEQELDLMIKDR
jgi:hypothetical protein